MLEAGGNEPTIYLTVGLTRLQLTSAELKVHMHTTQSSFLRSDRQRLANPLLPEGQLQEQLQQLQLEM